MSNNSIVFVINSVQTMSGASKVMLSVAEASLSLFDYVTVVGILNTEDEVIADGKIKYIPLCANPSQKGLWRLNCAKKLRAVFKELSPDIICSFVADACAMSRLASIGLKTTVVSCERGDPYTTGRMWQNIMRATYHTSDYSVFQLPSARDFFSKKVKSHSVVIPNPFIPKATPIDRDKLDSKTIVSAGRLFDKQKDFTSLINAFSKIHEVYPEYKLIIYGEGPSRSQYETQIKELNLGDCVLLPGFVNNVSEEIRDKGIFVLSSVFEGIPNTLLEAMSMGLPCVATKCSPGGAEFLTNNGEYGKLIEIGDTRAMIDSIMSLIEDKDMSYKLGLEAKKSITRFEPKYIHGEWIKLFESLLR